MIPKELQQIINDLEDQLPYMETALDHINCAISVDGTKQRPVTNPIGMSSDLTDGINLLRKLCNEYSNTEENKNERQ